MIFIAIYIGRKDFQICPRIGEWSNRDQSGIRASYIVNFLTPEGEHRLNYYVIYRWKGLWFGKSILRYRLCRRFDKNSLDSSDLLNCSFLRSSFVSFFFLPPLAIYGQISSSNPPHISIIYSRIILFPWMNSWMNYLFSSSNIFSCAITDFFLAKYSTDLKYGFVL